MRRSRHDVFAKASQPRYVVIWDSQWHLIEFTELAPGSDLYCGLVTTIERQQREGWRPEGVPDHGFLFLSRGGDRRLLMLTARHPRDQSRQSFDPFAR